MVEIDVQYVGELHCTAQHGPSGATLETDAPVDNHGRGRSFSPTDLLATALGTCMATVMGIQAQQRQWDLAGMRVRVGKIMTSKPPRRVARLETVVHLPPDKAQRLDDGARAHLAHTAETCPVRLSLLDAIEVPIRYAWGS